MQRNRMIKGILGGLLVVAMLLSFLPTLVSPTAVAAVADDVVCELPRWVSNRGQFLCGYCCRQHRKHLHHRTHNVNELPHHPRRLPDNLCRGAMTPS